MSEAYLTNWSLGSDWTERPDPMHEPASAETRVAPESHARASTLPAPASRLARIRQAFAGRPATECGPCPA